MLQIVTGYDLTMCLDDLFRSNMTAKVSESDRLVAITEILIDI